MPPITPHDETEGLWTRSGARFSAAVGALARATLARDPRRHAQAFEDARVLFAQALSWCDLLGRRRIAMLARAARKGATREARFSSVDELNAAMTNDDATWVHPEVPATIFNAAVDDVLTRYPEIAPGYLEVQRLYAERHAFALAKSLDLRTTDRVKKAVTGTLTGLQQDDPAEVIAEIGNWSRAYGETVWRTNMTTAYTAGVWGEIAQSEVMVGARYVATLDADTRPNHAACDGLIAPKDSRLWDTFSPPAGFNCRCGLEEVSIFDAEREGLVGRDGKLMTLLPPGFGVTARPDPGFGNGRPDRRALFGSIS